MNCPVCNRNNAVTLSICPSCGAMINDSVREELKPERKSPVRPFNFETKTSSPTPNNSIQPSAAAEAPKAGGVSNPTTGKLEMKPTSPTLVEFHNKNAAVPEWRLQLQNAVRKRKDGETETVEAQFVPQKKLVTNGANALKAEVIEQTAPIQQKHPTLKSALERIEKSRQQFLTEEQPAVAPEIPPPATNKNYPFYIASKQTEVAPPIGVKASVNPPVRPKLATSLRTEAGKQLDTNKLPPIPAKVSSSFVDRPVETIDVVEEIAAKPVETIIEKNFVEPKKTEAKIVEPLKIEADIKAEAAEVEEIEEYDDLAPFAMRFNSGLFDLIIGSFASLILLSPFMISGEGWFTFSGFLAFAATCAVVMFAYLTIAVGFYGRTIGMRLFSLELIDIDGETYPTMHQAAVSSSVYLLSLAFGGIGFLTLFFNEEKRAAHDLVSKTIIVKEC